MNHEQDVKKHPRIFEPFAQSFTATLAIVKSKKACYCLI
ncbi:hypothetical protein J2S10_004917 [Neobacillus ginsengisoli]|uniref:Uncharacterized protein n=1 Tax=Neobacillus ginsengisoli TaxID=904295 RepID=A0ABT9Y1L7_9BACI|nr:hypothetical protein [Neobacillus ginsengisoli]